jgi:futalosine hydrolase
MPEPSDKHRRLLDPLLNAQPLLLVVAAPTEARAVIRGVTGISPADLRIAWDPIELDDRVSILLSGVGKSNAAGATASALGRQRFGAIISLGVGGALPKTEGTGSSDFHHQIGDSVRCLRSVFADEGVETDDGWQTMAQRGFGPRQGMPGPESMSIEADHRLMQLLEAAIPDSGRCATVSTCSGTSQLARRTAQRSGCTIEAMEGAAVGLIVQRIAPEIPFLELRVISNRTGSDPGWDIETALRGLSAIASVL